MGSFFALTLTSRYCLRVLLTLALLIQLRWRFLNRRHGGGRSRVALGGTATDSLYGE